MIRARVTARLADRCAARVRRGVRLVEAVGAGCAGRSRLARSSLPDLARMDPPVQAQVKQRYATLMEKRKAGASGDELGAAYGEYAMLLQAAEYYEAAEPAYLNAQDLMPGDVRWPYYLGHLYKSIGQTEKSIQAFTRALDRNPSEIATLIWLGRLYLEQGKPDEAEPLFDARRAIPPRNVAVLAGLGQAALARRDYQTRRRRCSRRRWPRSERRQHPLPAGQRVSRPWRHGESRSAPQAVAEHRYCRSRSPAAGSRHRRSRAGCRTSCAACARSRAQRLQGRRRVLSQGRRADAGDDRARPLAAAQAGHRARASGRRAGRDGAL